MFTWNKLRFSQSTPLTPQQQTVSVCLRERARDKGRAEKTDMFGGIYDDGVRCGVNENGSTPREVDWMEIVYCWILSQIFPFNFSFANKRNHEYLDTLSYFEYLCPLGTI